MCASPASRSAAGLAVVVRCDELAVVDGDCYRWIQGIECARAAGLLNRVVMRQLRLDHAHGRRDVSASWPSLPLPRRPPTRGDSYRTRWRAHQGSLTKPLRIF